MKKWIAAILCTLVVMVVSISHAETLPTINQVLGQWVLPNEKIEVSDDLSAYDPDNIG